MIPIEKTKAGYEYAGETFDSKEEIYFSWWCRALFERGYISDFRSGQNVEPYDLSEAAQHYWDERLKTKLVGRAGSLLQAHSYKPDFSIIWSGLASGIFVPEFGQKWTPPLFWTNGTRNSYIDVKPGYQQHQARAAVFAVNQKWVWSKHGIFVQPVVVLPDSAGKPKHALFPATFTPDRFRWTDSGRQERKIGWKVRSLDEFFEGDDPGF